MSNRHSRLSTLGSCIVNPDDLECSYGCPQERPQQLCDICGHSKLRHLYVHPHRCLGTADTNGIHTTASCHCTGFVASTAQVVGTLEFSYEPS